MEKAETKQPLLRLNEVAPDFEAVIVPSPQTQADAEKRLSEGYKCTDWFLCKRKLPSSGGR